MKLRDYPGTRLPRKELHKRLMAAYQLAGRLLLEPSIDADMEPGIRTEMVIVLLDFLSDPTNADVDRLTTAARAFAQSKPASSHWTIATLAGPTYLNGDDLRMNVSGGTS